MNKIWILFISLLLLFSGCKKQTKTISSAVQTELFKQYITDRSQSPVSRCRYFHINLAFRVPDSIAFTPDILTFSPPITGVPELNENRDRIIIKNPGFEHNVSYEVAFHIGRLTSLPEGMETYRFPLEVERQAWRIEMQAPVCKSIEKTDITGRIYYDVCEPDPKVFEKGLSASQEGKTLRILWGKYNKANKYYEFEVKDIQRKEEAGIIQLKLSMAPINVKEEIHFKVMVPSKSDFSLHSTTIESNQHLALHFTDPIKSHQLLNGMIHVQGRKIRSIKVVNNTIHVYFKDDVYGKHALEIQAGIHNIADFPLKDTYKRTLFFAPPKPEVLIAEPGNILPPSGKWELPVSTVSASGFRLRILRVYAKNTHRYFQENAGDLTSQNGLENLGRIVLDTTFELVKHNFFRQTAHSIVLDRQIRKERGALYKIFLSIPPEHNRYPCDSKPDIKEKDRIDRINFDKPYLSYSYDYEYDGGYGNNAVGNRYYHDPQPGDYKYLPDPCSEEYATLLHDQRLLLCTDIGLVVKSEPANGRFLSYVSHITTAEPIPGATVQLFDFQGAKIASSVTGATGIAVLQPDRMPFLAKVLYQNQVTYLTLNDATALSMSAFQVEGRKWKGSDNVYFYGERDVWRPGDSIYLQCMIFNRDKRLPKQLPVRLTLYDPNDQKVKEWVVHKNVTGIYDCRFKTRTEDITGYWTLKMNLGGVVYAHQFRLETIRPNRLKIAVDFKRSGMPLNRDEKQAPITVKWMHGLPAKELEVEVSMLQKSLRNPFGSEYKNVVFDDITKSYSEDMGVVKTGKTNEDGVLNFAIPTEEDESYPSLMLFNFEVRAYEKGGAFSSDLKTIKYSPYNSYVGVQFPEKPIEGTLYFQKDKPIRIFEVSPEGKKISGRVHVTLQKIESQWWYQFGSRGDYSALKNHVYKPAKDFDISVNRSGATVSVGIGGHYLITFEDKKSGHTVSRVIYCYNNSLWSEGGEEVSQLEVLPFHIEKEAYKVGEFINFTLPALPDGYFLVTVESQGKIVHSQVEKSAHTPIPITLSVDKNMTPTAYIQVHFIQAWNHFNNDRPLRLYGVKPLRIYDERTVLHPNISMPKKIQEGKDFEIKISEKNGKPMTYTLAIVDEGLLDITQFHTPDPWAHFFSKEALSGKTWDVYQDIFQRFLGEYSSLLAVGGDGVNAIKPMAKAQRFKPTVQFIGPITLSAGAIRTHRMNIKNYVGSVRVMVVATNGNAFGHSEETAPVAKPLMLYATLPRVLGPGETLKVPVTVFAMDPKISSVEVQIISNDKFKIQGPVHQHLVFDKTGEKDIAFEVEIPKRIGLGKLAIEANAGTFRARTAIEIDVRPSSPLIHRTQEEIIPANQAKTLKFKPFGMPETQGATLTLSKGLNLSLEMWVKSLAKYPHGCLEQTVSSIFPQVLLYEMVPDRSASDKVVFNNRFKAALQKLRYMQLPSGGFSYWPGGREANSWGTSYAIEFLLAAKEFGYSIPEDMLSKALDYTYETADRWRMPSARSHYSPKSGSNLDQAYRLYVLSKAKKPNYAALNRLRLVPQLTSTTQWLLGYSLYLVGEKRAADKVLEEASTYVEPYRESAGTFGSGLRDQAIIVRVLLARGEKLKAKRLIDEMVKTMNESKFHALSTQEIAQSLVSFIAFINGNKKQSDPLTYDLKLSKEQAFIDQKLTETPVSYTLEKKVMSQGALQINNKSAAPIYATLALEGQPLRDETGAEAQDLQLKVRYILENGTEVKPELLDKGTDFIIECEIKHPGARKDYDNMALTLILPSGWEIINQNLGKASDFDTGSPYDYQDIRDDRVYTYFNLKKGQSKVFRTEVNATYAGKYWAPAVKCEAMYSPSIRAKTRGFWATVK